MAKNKKIPVSGNVAKIVFVLLMFVAIAGIFKVYSMIDASTRKEVEIVNFKEAVKSGDPILEDNIIKGTMIETDFLKAGNFQTTDDSGKEVTVPAIVKWEDREQYYETYASYYTRANTPVYAEVFVDSIPDNNPWIEEMEEGYEVIFVDLDFLELGGKTLIPGDRIRMRAVYQVSARTYKSDASTSQIVKELAASYIGDGFSDTVTNLPKANIMFDNIRITDMLNSDGDSILKLYYEISKYPISERTTMLSDEKFVSKLKPVKIGFAVDKDNATRLVELSELSGAKLFYSLLKRDITDYVTDFQNINNAILSLESMTTESE